jgi:hypothetical protein
LISNETHREAPFRLGNDTRQNSSELVKTAKNLLFTVCYKSGAGRRGANRAHATTTLFGSLRQELHHFKELFLRRYPFTGPEARNIIPLRAPEAGKAR